MTLNSDPRVERNSDSLNASPSDFSIVLHRLDDLDIRIIKELGSPGSFQWNVRESYSNIARRLGVDEETVRKRLKRAEDLGPLPSWRMMVNPRLIDCEAASLDLDVEEEEKKDEAIAEIRRVDGVIKILDSRGRGLQVTFYYQNGDALRTKTELIRSICGSKELTFWKLGFPRSGIRMTKTDWKIVEAMQGDARKNLEEVSDSIGVSVRTIGRRLTLMKDGRAVYLQGAPNFRTVVGVSCVFLVFCRDEEKKRAVDRLILTELHRNELSDTSSRQYSKFVGLFDNASEADDITKWIKGLDGVNNVKMGIMKELIVVQDWLGEEIGKRLAKNN